MRIYISGDIEGVSGVVTGGHGSPDGPDYSRARMLMTREVAATGEAFLEAGAEVVINDAHGPQTNLLIEELPKNCRLITGSGKPLGMMEGIDAGFDGCAFVGYHARAGTPGVLNHTIAGFVHDLRVNGASWGETTINAALAGSLGVPLLLVSGDEGLAPEVQALETGTELVVVKESKGRYAASCLAPPTVHQLLRDAAARTLRALGGGKGPTPFIIEGQSEVEIVFADTARADMAAMIPGVRRSGHLSCAYAASDYMEAFRVIRVMIAMASTARR